MIYENEKLPAKHIRGMAYEEAFGESISKSEYSGGMETKKFFERLGFSVISYDKEDETLYNIQLDEKRSNFQNILDKKIVNIDDKISNFLKNFKKSVKYVKTRTDKFENFNKKNLISKLEDELSFIFKLKEEIPFHKEIKEYNYSIDNELYQNILKFYSQATELIEKTIKLFNQEDKSLKTFLCNKLNNLSQNIVCRKIYGLVYYKIFDAIKNEIYNSINKQFSDLMDLINLLEIDSI